MTSLHVEDAFLSHFQLSHDPFAARVPGFKFFPAQRKSVLGQLHHLARYSQLLLAVVGPRGSGKTLVRQALVASANKQTVQCIVLSGQGGGEVADFLDQIAQGLKMPNGNLAAIQAQVIQLALTGQEVYLLVDDAEHLSDPALEALMTLAAGNAEARAHVFVFGAPSLAPRLELLADGEERIHVIELQPYTEEETCEYLAQRLDGAGRGIELFSAGQIADIQQQSEGWPGQINRVAREVLIEAMLAERGSARRSGFSLNLPKKHLLAVGVVALAVGAAWFMQGRSTSEPSPSPAPVAQLPLNTQTPAAPAPDAAGRSTPIEFGSASKPLPLPLVGEAQPVMRQPLAEAAGAASDEELAALPMSPPTPASTPAPANPAAPPAQAPVAAAAPPAPAASAKPAASVPAPVPKAPAASPAPAPASAAPSSTASWYASQPAGNYVLQILGTRSEQSAKSFVSQYGGDYRYFKKPHQGQPLYVVTYGNFPTRAAAQAAIQTLPAKVKTGKPWPKSFASVQQEAGLFR